MALVSQINENGLGGLNLSSSGTSRSVLITKYSAHNVTNDKMNETNVMDMRQKTVYVML